MTSLFETLMFYVVTALVVGVIAIGCYEVAHYVTTQILINIYHI